MAMIAATLTADLRSRASYVPPCPVCSHLQIKDMPDIIRYPQIRQFRDLFTLSGCCRLSDGCPWLDSPADVSSWWRARRSESCMNLATDERRRRTLERLKAKGLEAL